MPANLTTHTFVSFRKRSVDPAQASYANHQAALRIGRSYQRQHITLVGNYNIDAVGAGGFGTFSLVALMPGDTVVAAVFYVLENLGAVSYDVEINGTLQGANLGGTWTSVPNQIDITPFATPASTSRLYARVKNLGGAGSTIDTQLIVTVLR